MATDASSMASTLQPTLPKPWYTLIQYKTPADDDYSSAQYKQLRHSVVERLTLKIGPEPSEAIIQLPVNPLDAEAGKRTFLSDVIIGKGRSSNELAPFRPIVGNLFLWSKVRIFAAPGIFPDDMNSNLQDSFLPLFIGYVTDFQYFSVAQDSTGVRIWCKDARELLRKTPAYGTLWFNRDGVNPPGSIAENETVFIRDREIIFNEGQQPNRYHDPSDLGRSHQRPVFINPNHNRFLKVDPLGANLLVGDNFTTDPTLVGQLTAPFADKWRPGDVWNYFSNLIDSNFMKGANRLYNVPATELGDDFIPPLRDSELKIQRIMNIGDKINGIDANMLRDWQEPRATVGAISQTGLAAAISGVGEFDPTGMPLNEVFFRLCRMVGNYTMAVYYDEKDRAVLTPIRTVQAFTEDKDIAVGLQGRPALPDAGKALQIRFPTVIDTEQPNVPSLNLKATTDTYYNDFLMKAGFRFVTATFSTFGRSQFVDSLGQVHQPYNFASVPAGQWLPALAKATLVPGWTLADQNAFIAQFLLSGDTEQFPDVFRTWIIPQEGLDGIDWVAFFGQTIVADVPGFRRFLVVDRKLQNQLAISIFNTTLGLFRGRREKLPVEVSRAFRGIRTDTDGRTAYGDNTTENDSIVGFDDWFKISDLAGFDLLSDGRIGIRLHSPARLNKNFRFENHVPKPVGSGSSSSPMSWNGLSGADARHYEMVLTLQLAVDEDLFEKIRIPNTGTRSIVKYGPRLEMYRNAGNEWGQEHAIHSIVARKNPQTGETRYIAVPPVKATGFEDNETRVFRDDADEVLARTRMMANRHAMIDIEGELHLDSIYVSLWAGDFVDTIEKPGEAQIAIRALLSSVTHDFQAQRTTLQVATVR